MVGQTPTKFTTGYMETLLYRVEDIRNKFKDLYQKEQFTIDRTGAKTIEIIGTSFIADEEWIIRKPSYEYISRELDWYLSQSLYVEDIPGKTPTIWEQIASKEGKINSNYGWCIFSNENSNQYKNALRELKSNKDSRRASMIYNRPSMHYDYNVDGMNDFMCTYANTVMIRNDKLVSHYLMRSNDSVFGYDNDYAWAKFVQKQMAEELKIECGELIWTATNIHVYERHFDLLK